MNDEIETVHAGGSFASPLDSARGDTEGGVFASPLDSARGDTEGGVFASPLDSARGDTEGGVFASPLDSARGDTEGGDMEVALRYVPVPEEIAEEARRTRVDRFGHRLAVSRGAEPCRVCLRIGKQPEDLLLLSYQPLPDTGPYAEIGPIFIHANRCEPYARTGEFPQDFASRSLVLRAYAADGTIVDATVAQPGETPQRAAEFLRDPHVAEVHVRHVSYTCFDFKIVRQ